MARVVSDKFCRSPSSRQNKTTSSQERANRPWKMKKGPYDPMRTNLATVLDPNRRSNDAKEFDSALHRKIVGQDHAIDKVVEIYQMFLAGLNAPGRPVGNLLFLGPTGSGKTRVVEAMAEALFGDAHACIKIDCAEFQHSHEIAKLIGSPPGYLGHRETHPLLTQEALNQWH